MSTRYRDSEDGVREAVADGVEALAGELQALLDALHAECAGMPEEAVAERIRATLDEQGWELDEDEVVPYARAISEGTRIRVETGPAEGSPSADPPPPAR